jgi:hypothetical protein
LLRYLLLLHCALHCCGTGLCSTALHYGTAPRCSTCVKPPELAWLYLFTWCLTSFVFFVLWGRVAVNIVVLSTHCQSHHGRYLGTAYSAGTFPVMIRLRAVTAANPESTRGTGCRSSWAARLAGEHPTRLISRIRLLLMTNARRMRVGYCALSLSLSQHRAWKYLVSLGLVISLGISLRLLLLSCCARLLLRTVVNAIRTPIPTRTLYGGSRWLLRPGSSPPRFHSHTASMLMSATWTLTHIHTHAYGRTHSHHSPTLNTHARTARHSALALALMRTRTDAHSAPHRIAHHAHSSSSAPSPAAYLQPGPSPAVLTFTYQFSAYSWLIYTIIGSVARSVHGFDTVMLRGSAIRISRSLTDVRF